MDIFVFTVLPRPIGNLLVSNAHSFGAHTFMYADQMPRWRVLYSLRLMPLNL